MSLDLSCPDWWSKLQNCELPIADIDLNLNRAQKAVAALRRLCFPDVPNQPKIGDVGGKWFIDLVAVIFGTVDDDGVRWIREFFKLIPKKNSKTTNSAAIMIVALLVNDRPRAEFHLYGPTQDVAQTCFNQAMGMIEADPFLKKLFHIKSHSLEITHRRSKATLRVLSFDNKVATGTKPAGVLIDELHVIGKSRHATRVIEQIRGGYEVNPEAFLIFITTQSDEPPVGAFKTELDYARAIRDGEEKGDMLPVLFEFPREMQLDESMPFLKSEIFYCVHPNMGKTRHAEDLEKSYQKAKSKGIEELAVWLSQHLNIQIGIGLHKDRWRGVTYWESASDFQLSNFDEFLARCEVVTVGIDGGGLDDLLGSSFTGRDKATGDWLFTFKAWMHQDAYDARKSNQATYDQFFKEGYLTKCDYPTQDVEELADLIERISNLGLLPDSNAIGLDPVGVAAIQSELELRGIAHQQMVGIPQGYKLSGVIKGFERRLKDGRVKHDGSSMMKWVVGNAKTEQRGNALLITKQISGVAKIDPLIAGFNSFELMSRDPAAVGVSNYENEQLLFV